MMFLLFGFLFITLFNSPVCIKSNDLLHQEISNLQFYIIFFGIRLLFSVSGYILFYKFICFLDDRTEEEKKLSNSFLKKSSIQLMTKSCGFVNVDSNKPLMRQYTKIQFLFIFISLQLHKYLLFLFCLVFLKCSLYYLFLLFNEIGPMWEFFKRQMLDNTKWPEIIQSFFLIHSFFWGY